MNRLFEILGRAIDLEVSRIIWHWFENINLSKHITSQTALSQFNTVLEMIEKQRFEKAENELRLYLFENPGCILGRMAAASICIYNNQYSEAIEQLNSVYCRQPNNTMALYAMGYCYEQLHKPAQAAEFYQDCLKFKSFLELPRQRLAAIYLKNFQIDKVHNQYEQLVKEYPDHIPDLLCFAYLCMAKEEYERAVDIFNKAILMHPDNCHEFDEQIDYLIRQGLLEDALEIVQQQLNHHPDRAELMVKAADILARAGSVQEATDLYEQAVKMCPNYLEATIKLGTQYMLNQRDFDAAVILNQGVEINDKIVDAYIGLATAQKMLGYENQAVNTLSLAAAIQPNSGVLFCEGASLQYKLAVSENKLKYKDIDNLSLLENIVRAHLQQLENQHSNPDLYYRLGMIYMSTGKTTEAIKAFQSALEINPTFYRAESKLIVCLFDIGGVKEALKYLTLKKEQYNRESMELYYNIALLYCDKVKFASSLLNLEHHLSKNHANIEPATNISVVLQNLGLLDRSTEMWENISITTQNALNPGF